MNKKTLLFILTISALIHCKKSTGNLDVTEIDSSNIRENDISNYERKVYDIKGKQFF